MTGHATPAVAPSADRLLDEATDHPPASCSPRGRVVLATRRAGGLLLTFGQVAFSGTALLATGKLGPRDQAAVVPSGWRDGRGDGVPG